MQSSEPITPYAGDCKHEHVKWLGNPIHFQAVCVDCGAVKTCDG